MRIRELEVELQSCYGSILSTDASVPGAEGPRLISGTSADIAAARNQAGAQPQQQQQQFLQSRNRFVPVCVSVHMYVLVLLVFRSRSGRSRATGPSIKKKIQGKGGRIRMHLRGRRVNYSARSVITPDPTLPPDTLGIPEAVAKIMTVGMARRCGVSMRMRAFLLLGTGPGVRTQCPLVAARGPQR